MKKQTSIFFTIALIAISATVFAQSANGFGSSTTNNQELITKNSLKGSGMCFTPNKGQIADAKGNLHPEILYKGAGGGTDVYLRKTGMSYVTSNMGEVMREIDKEVELKKFDLNFSQQQTEELRHELEAKALLKINRTDVDFAGGNPNPQTLNQEEVEGYTNYYYAHCPNGITNVKSYNRVVQKNIYTGIDVIYYGGKQNGLKYDIVVNPGADPKQIKLKYTGAKVKKLADGSLQIASELGLTREYLPKVYQNINRRIVDVKCEYKLEMVRGSTPEVRSEESQPTALSNHYTVTFELRTYNHEHPLIIDPYWATYCGGGPRVDELASGVTTDNAGNVIISGYTTGGAFPVGNNGSGGNVTWQGTQGNINDFDAYVVKLDANGSRIWATYYGGDQGDMAKDITTDNTGNVIITGQTKGGTFPANNNGIGGNVTWQPLFNGVGGIGGTFGGEDAFVVKFDVTGKRLWATYYGGNQLEDATGVATDNAGNVSIVGTTSGGTFPANNSGGSNTTCQATYGGNQDAFAVKFDAQGNRLWATYYGGNKGDGGKGIATDNTGNVVITGLTMGGTFQAVNNGAGGNITWQSAFGGGVGAVYDAFVVKFDPNGNRLWATYYGGNQSDMGMDVATDNANNIIVVGSAGGGTFPIGADVAGGYITWQTTTVGGSDPFVLKLSPTGRRLFTTYYGGNQPEVASRITTDASDNIYLLMEEEDTTVPDPTLVDACAWQPVFNGGVIDPKSEDQIIVKFNPLGKKLCATYLGGTGEDDLDGGYGGIAVYGNSLYVTAQTRGGFPVTAGVFQFTYAGYWDAYLARLCTNICETKTLNLAYAANTTNVCSNTPVTYTPAVNNSCDTTGYRFNWSFPGGTPPTSTAVKPEVTYVTPGTYNVKLLVTTPCKKDSITKTNYITVNPCGGCTLNAQYTKGTANCTTCGCKEWIMVTGINGTPPYTYQWPDGYDKRYKNALCPGVYNVLITDNNGCKTTVKVNAP